MFRLSVIKRSFGSVALRSKIFAPTKKVVFNEISSFVGSFVRKVGNASVCKTSPERRVLAYSSV